ncbi:non-ribosomal peptide synthetase [Cohnella faecalis]|uniref:Amino acid adenylation domain-containing protein n=1 Tax=Cohnella faecalis TaxID=2315694 RepID=A0A398CT25_9BACL|nr:non-ribosomal peptide synthetase [Cohnella faecalis]RIE04409.1 amino acid adenylation domain-containing protein [Cohnella faecalis]
MMEVGNPILYELDDDREEIAEARDYWLAHLSDDPKPASIQPDRAEGGVDRSFGSLSFAWPEPLSAKLLELARGQDTLLYVVLLAGLATVVRKYGGESDMTVASPEYAGFGSGDGDARLATNRYLPIRCRLDGDMTVKELLTAVNRTVTSAYRYQYYPVRKALEKQGLEDRSYGKMACELTNIHDSRALESLRNSGDNEISVSFTRAEGRLEGRIAYDVSLFTERSVHTLLDVCEYVLEQAAADPGASLRSLELVRAPERERMLAEFSGNKWDLPANVSMSRLFEEQAAASPSRTAVVSGTERLTYGELNEKANTLADRLRRRGVGNGRVVGIMLEKSVLMVTSILAVLKAGGAYLPLDPGYPEPRLRHMLEDSGTEVLLTSALFAGRLPFAGNTVIVDAIPPEEEAEGDEAFSQTTGQAALADDLAYMIYTSGSTGKPKGVMVGHRGMVNLQSFFKRELNVRENDRILQFASASFDASVWELFMALFTGAELHLPAREVLESYDRFTDYLNGNGITIATLPPTFAAHLDPSGVQTLRLLITAGSATSPELVRRWKGRVEYVNAYGPTESTICATIWKADEAFGEDEPDGSAASSPRSVPIGKPILNADAYIVGCDGQLQPIGVMGELFIGGVGVALGYWGRDSLTAEKFVPNPYKPGETMYRSGDYARWLPDGNIDYRGRIDHQVKIRGFRIEIGEIETELLSHPDISEAAAAAKSLAEGDVGLCAYYVASSPIRPQEIKDWLALRLPGYMIPQYMIPLDKLPLTVNGKVDLAALPAPGSSGSGGGTLDENASETEKKLARLWSEVLGISSIGADAHFFEAGGHSLRAALLISEIHRTFHAQLSLRDVMEAPTLREMAKRIEENGGKGSFEAIVPAAQKPYYPLSPAQKRLYVLSRFDPESVAYNLPAALLLEGELDTDRLKRAFQALTSRHETLRTSFGLEDGAPVQFVHSSADVSFEIASEPLGEIGVDATEKAVKQFVRPFDPGVAPLLRVRVIRYSDTRHTLLLDMHHLISDGISTSVFIRDLLQLYAGERLDPLPLQYKDFACWQSGRLEAGGMEEQERHWLSQFSVPVPSLGIRTDYPRPSEPLFDDGDAVVRTIPAEKTNGLRELAASADSTLYMVLLAAYSTLLSRYSGDEDIVVGTPVAGRRHADLQGLIGMFINMLPMRTRPKAGLSFADYLNDVKDTALQALENQDYPFDELVRKLNAQRDFNRNPLFDASFALQNMDMPRIEAEGLAIEPINIRFHPAKFDLTLWAEEGEDGLRLTLEYRPALFKQETIAKMVDDLTTILDRIVEEPQIELGEIELLGDEEQRAMASRLARLEQDLEMEFEL